MSLSDQGIVDTVDELKRLLDVQIELLELRCKQLEDLCEATLTRDDEAMETVLGDIEQSHVGQESTDLKLRALRSSLAGALGWPIEDTRLARLATQLPPDIATGLDYRRQQIVLLSEKLKHRHMEAAVVVTECARVNTLLLEGLFPRANCVTTYGAGGKSRRSLDVGVLDLES